MTAHRIDLQLGRRVCRLLLRMVCIIATTGQALAAPPRDTGASVSEPCPLSSGTQLCPLFDRAAKGDIEAQRQLGLAYVLGRSVPRNEAEGGQWLRRAAEGGSVAAQNDYGEFLLHSETTVHEHVQASAPAEAAAWFRRAAEQGNGRAQTNLGTLYAAGRGVPRDLAIAFAWFRQAAEQGEPRGQFNLGVAYQLGDGVRRDLGAAASWYRRAALQGDARAMLNLASLLTGGRPEAESLVEAYAWLLVAEERGEDEIESAATAMLDRIAGQLTDEQHARAVARSNDITGQIQETDDQIDGLR